VPILYGQIAHRVSPSGGVVRDVLRAAGVFSGAVMLVEGGVGFLLTQLQADMPCWKRMDVIGGQLMLVR
jgi:hypothetical protein